MPDSFSSLSFTRPNLPFLIEEIESQVLQQSEV
jgi:hypothetical protein